jgi:hypothetical protein
MCICPAEVYINISSYIDTLMGLYGYNPDTEEWEILSNYQNTVKSLLINTNKYYTKFKLDSMGSSLTGAKPLYEFQIKSGKYKISNGGE